MLKNSSKKSEFHNQCSSSSKRRNFPPGFPRQRLNGLKNGNNDTASSRSITTRSKSNGSSLVPKDSYLVCGYAARRSRYSDSGCCSKNIERECEQNPQKNGIRDYQLKTEEATKSTSKVNIDGTCKKYSEAKLKPSCECNSSTCTVESGGCVSKRKNEDELGRPCTKFAGGTHQYHERSGYLSGPPSKTKVKGIRQTIPSTQTEISCECSSNTSTDNSHKIHPKTDSEDSSKEALPIKQDHNCNRRGYTLSSKVPERPLYTSTPTVFKRPHKHNLHKRYRKHWLRSRYKRTLERQSRKRNIARMPCNRGKIPENNKNKPRSVRTKPSRVRKKRDSTNKYQKITEKAMSLFEKDLDERSPGEINIQNKWNTLPANRKFYYLWIALGNDPLSEDPYQNYIKFKQHQTNEKVTLADLEGWSCLPYTKRMLFLTESFLARLFRTNETPSERLYKEYFKSRNKQFKVNNLKQDQESDRVLGEEKRCLRSRNENSLVGQNEKKPKLEKGSCSF